MVADVIAFMQGEYDDNGGRIIFDSGETTICVSSNGEIPQSLTEGPVETWIEDTGDATGESVRDEQTLPTLAHALYDIYGPSAGVEIEYPVFAPVVRVVKEA